MPIYVATTDEHDGVRIYAAGHAVLTNGEPERDKVCSAVSVLMITLSANVGGSWGGLDSGRTSCLVQQKDLRLAEFAMSGLRLIQLGYPEHLFIQRKDSQLFKGNAWSSIKFPEIK